MTAEKSYCLCDSSEDGIKEDQQGNNAHSHDFCRRQGTQKRVYDFSPNNILPTFELGTSVEGMGE